MMALQHGLDLVHHGEVRLAVDLELVGVARVVHVVRDSAEDHRQHLVPHSEGDGDRTGEVVRNEESYESI